ncbi:hypothetical protein [Dechloromonas sp. A34]|uniref:DUF7931 domain-containing protein n=1 Tax=Dechloromonas sp. A34 TaxID=447588 RepID=UPI0022488C4E|nr:hypothetical protein [Dechloromonas sp. A34]
MAIDRLLGLACRKIQIYDQDIGQLKLETPSRLDALKRVLQGPEQDALQIAVRDATALRKVHPLLNNLLTTYSHRLLAQQTSEQLAHLRDSMILVDDRHALIRFDHDQARSKLLIDEADEVRPYLIRFAEILSEGGESISSSTLGL